MYHPIVFLPLVGFLIAGLLRPLHRRAGERGHHDGAPVRRLRPVLDRLRQCRLRQRRGAHPGGALDGVRRPRRRLGLPGRYADGRDADRRDDGLGARAPLLDRLHARGSAPAALLRLPVAVHLRHADAGDGRQPRADVLRLGGRRPRQLPPDRLLVREALGQRRRHQGLHRQPGRRFRLRPRHLPRLRAVRLGRLRGDLPARRRAFEQRPSASSATIGTR